VSSGRLAHKAAELIEIPALVAEKGALGNTGVGLAALLYRAEQCGEPTRCQVGLAQSEEAIVEHVELHPHLGRDQRPKRARILPGIADRADDRGRIGDVDDVEFHHARRGRRRVGGEKAFLVRVQLDDRAPVLAAPAVAREGLVDVEDAREVLGALDIAREPEDAVRVTGEQNVSQRPRCPSSRRPARN
jgi:hypothetical protein